LLTFFGFMHGESVGIAVTPTVAVAYAIVAAFLFALSRAPAMFQVGAPMRQMDPEGMASMPAE
jgi:AGZA family xanthine/uracil permease-like MFS transporter